MPSQNLTVALSPCPNDTFAFHAWLEGFIKNDLPIEPTFADIELLNEWALEKKFPLTKLSFPCFAKVSNDYVLLDVGCALGNDVGPKLIAREPLDCKEIKKLKVAIPGDNTMAHFLSRHLLPQPLEKLFCRYDEAFSLLHQKKVDAAVVIHESRFTFVKEGFFEVADLGKLWKKAYNLPLPLGGIALRKDYLHLKQQVERLLKESLKFGETHPHISFPYVQKLAQEKEPDVIAAHIALYVNSETHGLTEIGKKAIEVFLQL